MKVQIEYFNNCGELIRNVYKRKTNQSLNNAFFKRQMDNLKFLHKVVFIIMGIDIHKLSDLSFCNQKCMDQFVQLNGIHRRLKK